MPTAMLRRCTHQGCPELVESGACGKHARERNIARGSANARGYGVKWRAFRERFRAMLIAAGVVPACGARMPGARETGDSACRQAGRLNDRRLHLDHTPPLTEAERHDPRAVCDPARVQFLCEACHNAKSAREAAA